MTAATFAATYLDPPNGILYVAYPNSRDNGTGDPGKAHFMRPKIADCLRRARRNSAMGMADATATATIPAWCTKWLNKAALIHDQNGTPLCPNIATDFAALTSLGGVTPMDA